MLKKLLQKDREMTHSAILTLREILLTLSVLPR